VGAGRRLWASLVALYELEEHERALLVEAERTLNLLADLDVAVRAGGAVVDSPQGMKAHPAAVEARQQRVAFAPLLAALRLPAGGEGDRQANARPARKDAVRGVYGFRAGAS